MGRISFGFVLFCVCVSVSTSSIIGDGCAFTTKALNEYLKTGVRPAYLDYALRQCPLPHVLNWHHEERAIDDSVICPLCEIAADLLIAQRRSGMSDEQVAAEAYYLCTSLNIETPRVCDGILKANVGIFLYIIDRNKDIKGNKICGLLISNCGGGNDYEWTIDIPAGETIDKAKANGTKAFNILHISDIHYDPLYTPGKTNQCGEPLCCQDDQPDGTDASDTCGYWSDYTDADTPFHTMQEALRQSSTHEFDYVYYTGDFVSHRVWSTSVQNNTRDITAVTDQFREYFDVPVYPVLGNHEPHPLNVWSSDGVDDSSVLSTEWVFELVAEQWGEWLTEDAKKTLLRGGYYTVSPRKGFRIVALNSNVCYIVNWWLINENDDPYDQLAWLAGVLLEAEKNQESVHIVSHIPSGHSECLSTWSREYRRLVKRFANTITGQFNGHTHKDELWVYYDTEDTTQAIGVSWNGASITPYSNGNPSYKVYQVDEETFDILDFEEWTFNLTLANLDPSKDVEWYKLYSFKDAYGANSLEPNDVDDLIMRMIKDHSLIQKYYNYKYRNSDVAVRNACNVACEKALLCSMVTTVSVDNEHCERVKQLYDENT